MADNLAKLQDWTRATLAFAEARRGQARTDYLMGWASKLNDDMARLGPDAPPHLVGLDASDLANARDRLAAAVKVAA